MRLQAKMSGIEDIDETDIDSMLLKKAKEANELEEIDPIDECNLKSVHFFNVLNAN